MITLLLLVQIAASNADKLQPSASSAEAKSAILCLAFSPDGKSLASGEVDKKVRLYDVATGKQKALLEGHTRQIAAVAFTPDGSTLASASYDHTVRLWDAASGKLKEVQAGDPKVGDVPNVDDLRAQFNKDVSLLAFGSAQQLWDLRTKKQRQQNPFGLRGWFDFESDGATLLSVCGSEKEINVIRNFERWDTRTGKSLARWAGTPGAAYERVAQSGDGAWAAALDAAGDGNSWKLELWTIADQKRTAVPGVLADFVNGMLFTKDGSALATGAGKTLKFWDVKAGKELASYPCGEGFMAMAISADGSRLATADAKGGIQIWSVK